MYRFSLRVDEKGLCWFLKRVNPSINTQIVHVFPKLKVKRVKRVKKINGDEITHTNNKYNFFLNIAVQSGENCWNFFTYIAMSVFFPIS